jgi:hypothetical protein
MTSLISIFGCPTTVKDVIDPKLFNEYLGERHKKSYLCGKFDADGK